MGEEIIDLSKKETNELVKDLRKYSRILHDETTLHMIADLMKETADRLVELMLINKELTDQLAKTSL